MSIFISHTTADDALAQAVYNQLKHKHHIECYIDNMDETLKNSRGDASLASLLVNRLRKCNTLLAIITKNTKSSWWVPFEIGTARQMPRAISSYTNLEEPSRHSLDYKLPEYLLEWPRLRTREDIDIFASQYNNSLAGKTIMTRDYATAFEASALKSLGQRIL